MKEELFPLYLRAKICLATNGYIIIIEITKSLSSNGRLSKLWNVIKEQCFEIYEDEERGDLHLLKQVKLEELEIDVSLRKA